MGVTRREFLKRTALATAGTMAAPGLFGNPLVRKACADTIGDRYLVIFFLDGGNDGLNTVIPINNAGGLRTAYEAARRTGGGGLRINEDQMAIPSVVPLTDPGTSETLGFHPAFASNKTGLSGIAGMYDAGNVAVVQGTGYPNYSLSHETSRIIWTTANPTGQAAIAGTGWAGRHLGLEYGPLDAYGVTIDGSIAGELRTTDTSVLAIDRLSRFGFPLDNYDPADHAIYKDKFELLYQAASTSDEALTALLGSAGESTLQSTESYPPLDGLYKTDRPVWEAAYSALGTRPARDLSQVAKIMYGTATSQPGINARFFQVHSGGYDTHADQGGATGHHFEILEQVSDAIDLFFQDITDMGLGAKTTMVVWSEFGRRIPQNSNGTDHGSQAPMFVIGEPVNGGVYGNHPNIAESALDSDENTPYSQDPSDPFRSTDFRDVQGGILKHWVNMPESQILSSVLPLDSLAPADKYWTVQNFDLGFL